MNCPHCDADVTEATKQALHRVKGDFVMMCRVCQRLIVVAVVALKVRI